MFISAPTLDDLLREVFEKLQRSRVRIKPHRGPARELPGVLLQLTNPRARLSHTETRGFVFSCLGELLWYLAGSDRLDFIAYYIDRYKDDSTDGKVIRGAYGPRLFGGPGLNQVANVLKILRDSHDSRRAVIQLLQAGDLRATRKWKESPPCTCTLQFMVRRGRLHMFTNMRSNDAFWGLSTDVFAFTMLQELLARSLDVELGVYKHAVGSLHLYDDHEPRVRQFLGEGWQPTRDAAMPPMPKGDPFPSVRSLLLAEKAIRTTGRVNLRELRLGPYWEDLVRLLQIYRHSVQRRPKSVTRVMRRMASRAYDQYIERRKRHAARPPPPPPGQQPLL